MTRRHLRHGAGLGVLLAAVAACTADRLVIPNYNAPTTEGVQRIRRVCSYSSLVFWRVNGTNWQA